MAIKSKNKVSIDFNMSSMSDMVFLILIFFMISSTQISPNGLQVALPKSSNQISSKQHVSVSITKDLQYAINSDFIAYENLEGRLQQVLAKESEPTLILRVDKDVPTGETVKIMDIASRNRWKFVLATKP